MRIALSAKRLASNIALATALIAVSAPAFAQYVEYGPRERARDESLRPAEFDGLELGRDAPFLNSEQVGVHAAGPGHTFEIEGPPIGPRLLPPRPAGQ
jgi:hypothetical protein